MSEGLLTSRPATGEHGGATATVPVRTLEGLVNRAVDRATRWLLAAQFPAGCWWGELEADITLNSDYIVFQHATEQKNSPKIPKLANHVRRLQLPDGGWNIFPKGPAELNATIKAYFALKLIGDDPQAPHMRKARERAVALGGIENSNSYTRFHLALMGVVDWDLAPAIPPELALLPRWFFVNIYEMSSWTRAIVVTLSVLYGLKPNWNVAPAGFVDELFADPDRKRRAFEWDREVVSWRNFFLATDRAMKLYERLPWKPFRARALKKAEKWLVDRMDRSEGLAAIYPSIQNSIFCLRALGYGFDDPIAKDQMKHLSAHEIEDGDVIRMQPCISPVWDTAIAMVSLEEAGIDPKHSALVKAAKWMLDAQITGGGDWQVKNRDAESGGWAFEFRNDHFPDVDDTAFVLMALARVGYPDKERMEAAVRRGVAWMLSMQNRDGGWGAFDRDNNLTLLNNIPFADHNAMLDPSTADVTARSMEALAKLGWPADHPAMKGALSFLRKDQAPDGPWYGRWGVNYVYGTSGVLRAMEALGLGNVPECQHAANWLRSVQNPDGGFGESLHSYSDSNWKGRGSSTASQTAWALIGLLAVCGANDPAVHAAVKYLVDSQNEDGTWDEEEFTGTGFPSVFYLKYHLYRNSFPLYALAHYRNLRDARTEFAATKPGPQGIAYRKLHRGFE
ncbi:MAG: squalene--hopene cyclase [Candidatus Acidiferrales bacterium]